MVEHLAMRVDLRGLRADCLDDSGSNLQVRPG